MQLAWDSSPAGHVANLTSPLLLIQGDSDANVNFQESIGLVRALRSVLDVEEGPEGVLETLIVPDERHGLALFRNQVVAADATADFLRRRIGGGGGGGGGGRDERG